MRELRGLLLLGCVGCAGPAAAPLVEAHRGGAGYWPGNSESAVKGSIAAAFEGLEVDLVLTADGHAVLSHDPFLEPEQCIDRWGEPLERRIRLDELSRSVLQRGYLCGGATVDEHPNAEVRYERPMSLDDLLEVLEDAPGSMRVHLDLKIEKGWTAPAEDWLEPVLDRWWEAELPQPLVISANTADAVRAFEDHARTHDRELHSLLIFPEAPTGSSATAVGLAAERDSVLGKVDYVDLIEEADADGIAVNWEIAERGQLYGVQHAGYEVALWTVNTGPQIDQYRRWPVDVVISDYPGAEP